MRALRFALVVALLAGVVSPADAARADRTGYERALARERALSARTKPEPTEAELRSLSVSIENIARRFPTSGYADNALLKAAALAEQLYGRFHRDADAKRAVLLYQWLVREYPSSPLVKPARAAARALESASRPVNAKAAAPAADERVASPAVLPASTAPAVSPPVDSAAGSPPLPAAAAVSGQRLREVRRSVLPEVVRVTLEIDGEVPYQHERIDGPPRLFFDLRGVQPVPELLDAVLTWPDDVVRQVRMGRKAQNTTRVVLDLEGVSRYSVFTLYNPFRVVVDLERETGKRPGLVPRAAKPAVVVDRTSTAPVAPPVVTAAATPPPTAGAPASVLPAGNTRSKTPGTTRGVVAPQTALVLPAPAPPVPTSTRSLTPEGPESVQLVSASGEPATAAVAPEQLRLTPEHSITSREIELATPAASAAAVGTAGTTLPDAAKSTPPANSSRKSSTKTRPSTRRPAVTPQAEPPIAATTAIEVPAAPARAAEAQPLVADASLSTGPAESIGPPPVPATVATVPASPAPTAPEANGNGGFSLARQLGLGISRIVIDPGHGGHDPGAQGKGLSEAELVLDVALRLEKLLQKQQGMDVVLTRRTDVFVPLEERTAIANRSQADLFLSIHANASRNVKARGVETYFLNFASNPEAEAVAARENSASAKTMHNLPDIVRAIALNTKLDESRDFAQMVQSALVKRLSGQNKQLRDLGVKQAPFVVLIGAVMPSVLAEISFLTHPQEAQLLRSNAYRQRVADALYDAVLKYQRSLKAVSTVAQQ